MIEEDYKNHSNKEVFADIFLAILRYVPVKENYDEKKYKEELQQKLKFKRLNDPDLFRGCVDLLEDTELALNDYLKYGLGEDRLAEKYLRLYGVLSTIYQQIDVIIELVDLFNYPEKNKITEELKSLEAIKLRNKLGAHTINYQIDKRKKATRENLAFFRLAQSSITGWGENLLLVSSYDGGENVNLLQLIKDYHAHTDRILIEVCRKAIDSVFKNKGKSKDWLTDRFNYLEKRI
jgi:hypothetical protein